MSRRGSTRRVGFLPHALYFKPQGVTSGDIEEILLGNDEVEAIRLKDLLGMSQGEAARQMQISQSTFHRLILMARQKIADAFINGKAVRIEGGNIDVEADFSQPCRWRKRWGCKAKVVCPDGAWGGITRVREGGLVIVAVTGTDGTIDGMVDERFGRSRKIILYNKEKGSFEAIDNTGSMNVPQGAGIRTARVVAGTPAQAVISGHLGPNAFSVLREAGIEAYTASHVTVREALEMLDRGQLTRLDSADVEGHW